MSSEEFEFKRLGYTLAGYVFHNDQNAMMMVQNMIKKVIIHNIGLNSLSGAATANQRPFLAFVYFQ